jgi:amino-acid N-acetyltransferase
VKAGKMDQEQFIRGFRESSPYIHRFRGQTFVISLEDEALSDGTITSIASDVALLRSLGIGVILVFGASSRIKEMLEKNKLSLDQNSSGPIVPEGILRIIREAVGSVRFEIESALSRGGDNSSMSGAQLKVVSGNYVIAQPVGVIDGVDHFLAGNPRHIRAEFIKSHIAAGEIVLISSLGVSLSGELFFLDARDVAQKVAEEVGAQKLLFLMDEEAISERKGEEARELTTREAQTILGTSSLSENQKEHLLRAIDTVSAGVDRVHLVNRLQDGALLLELFTRDGCGTLISSDPFESISSATLDDIPGILEMIRPLEASGILKGRSRETIETDISRFSVTRRDRNIIGCGALYPFPDEKMGEIACLAVHPDYRRCGRAGNLLSWFEKKAREEGMKTIFVLSTQTGHWFSERGFTPCLLEELPPSRRESYNHQRKSLILKKNL